MFKGVIAIDGQEHHITGVGNGAISSLANALKSLGIDLDITDYKEHAIGEGKEVKAATYIECTASGNKQQKVWGVGIHEDVVQASLMALLSAASSVTKATEAPKENGVVAHLESQINGA
jgi:2-isopropylmalate synthase